jgi:penicillin-binding protein 1A
MQLARDVGLEAIARTAHDLGIETKVPVVPSMALGSANVSPYEMLRAYMTFANRGRRIDPYFVRNVTDADGNILFEAHRRRTEVYPQRYADVINHVLAQTISRGTGTAADIGRPAAGKTGTTTDHTDAWFVGYTPKLGTAVWMGYPDGTARKMSRVHGRAVTGGSFPAQIWQRFMLAATRGQDTGEFVEPDPELVTPSTAATTSTTSTPVESTTSSEATTSTSGVPGESTTTSEGATTTIPGPPSPTTTTTSGAGRP